MDRSPRSTTARRGGSTTRFHGEDGVITLLDVVSFMGKPIFLLFAIGIPGLWIFMHGGRKLGIFLAVTCIGGGIVDTIVKVGVGRPRPEVEEPIVEAFGKSFPSGHSMQAVVCYGALLLVLLPLLNGRMRTLAICGLRRAVPRHRLLAPVARRPLHQRRPRRLRARRRLAGRLGRRSSRSGARSAASATPTSPRRAWSPRRPSSWPPPDGGYRNSRPSKSPLLRQASRYWKYAMAPIG